jgi:hypothetical protein
MTKLLQLQMSITLPWYLLVCVISAINFMFLAVHNNLLRLLLNGIWVMRSFFFGYWLTYKFDTELTKPALKK